MVVSTANGGQRIKATESGMYFLVFLVLMLFTEEPEKTIKSNQIKSINELIEGFIRCPPLVVLHPKKTT